MIDPTVRFEVTNRYQQCPRAAFAHGRPCRDDLPSIEFMGGRGPKKAANRRSPE